jgi:hypothetical protein
MDDTTVCLPNLFDLFAPSKLPTSCTITSLHTAQLSKRQTHDAQTRTVSSGLHPYSTVHYTTKRAFKSSFIHISSTLHYLFIYRYSPDPDTIVAPSWEMATDITPLLWSSSVALTWPVTASQIFTVLSPTAIMDGTNGLENIKWHMGVNTTIFVDRIINIAHSFIQKTTTLISKQKHRLETVRHPKGLSHSSDDCKQTEDWFCFRDQRESSTRFTLVTCHYKKSK